MTQTTDPNRNLTTTDEVTCGLPGTKLISSIIELPLELFRAVEYVLQSATFCAPVNVCLSNRGALQRLPNSHCRSVSLSRP